MPKRELRIYDTQHDSQIYLGECRNQVTRETELEIWTERLGRDKRALMGPSAVLTMEQAEIIAAFILDLRMR